MSYKTKKNCVRFLSIVLAVLLLIPLGVTVFANAEEPQYPTELTLNIKIKENATTDSVKKAADAALKAEHDAYPIESIVWPSNTDFDAESGSIDVNVIYADETTAIAHIVFASVAPSGVKLTNTLSKIDSTDTKNVTADALLAYVNSDLTLTAIGSTEYDAAFGDVDSTDKAPAFTWSQCDRKYATAGDTYTFTQSYNGSTLTRIVTVETANYSVRSLKINYNNDTVNTTANMKWALTKNATKWNSCSANMSIVNSWLGETVYFYIPGDKYANESSVVSLYIPERATKPTAKLQLSSTTHSITIENLWDYDNCEFRLGNGTWKTTRHETYTFKDLDAGTSYKVYIRTCADDDFCLVSDALSTSISTKAAIQTKVTVDKNYENNIGYVDANAVVAPTLSSSTLRGSLTATDLNTFNNVIRSYDEKFNKVVVTTAIELFAEDGDSGFSNVNFSVPMSALTRAIYDGNTALAFECDFGRIDITNAALRNLKKTGNLSIQMQKPTSVSSSSSWKWLKTKMNEGAEVYKVTVTGGSSSTATTVTYTIPYRFAKDETIHSLNVYYVDNKGNYETLDYTYDGVAETVNCTLTANGYIVIVNDGENDVALPFSDIANDYWAYDEIRYCYNKGLFNGVSKTLFAPNGEISKAEIIALLARLDGFDGRTNGTLKFTDVDENAWYAPYAMWAYNKGIVTGKTFGGEQTMQRQEIAKLIYDYLRKADLLDDGFDNKNVEQYSDNKTITSSYRTAVQYLRYIDVMGGIGDNTFAPTLTVTRCQMAAMMYRLASEVA